MNNEEKQVLHGLYWHIGVGNAICIKPSEICWLIKARLPKGKSWKNEKGELNSFSIKSGDYLEGHARTIGVAEKPLRYLQQAGFLNYGNKGELFEISVTSAGADLARELDSWLGRLDVHYRQSKDGLWGLVVTVAVAILTSVMTTLIISKR